MAKKKTNPLEDPPTASSSDDDEVESLSGDDEKEQISDDSSSEDLIIPSVTKPKEYDTGGGSSAVKKRKMEKTEVPAKRAKVSEEEMKKPSSQRLWSEEDEISVLQGMIDFKADIGKSPYEDMDRFYQLTMKSISFEASKIQFVDKIRSLKRKYMGKGVESLHKPHEIACLKLSKHIWGMPLHSKTLGKEMEEEEVVVALESNGTPKKKLGKEMGEEEVAVALEPKKKPVSVDKVEEGGGSKSLGVKKASDWFEDSFLVGYIAGLGVSERFVKQQWSMVTVETKKRMEDKWKLLQAKEMELVLQKTDFMRDIGSVIAEAP